MKTLGSISESGWSEDGDEFNPETKNENWDGDEKDEKDWFLEAFLVGYRKEKDRRQRLKAEKAEREKKAMDNKKIENERRREEREKFENKMMMELDYVRKTLETLKEEEGMLRLEVEELRRNIKEEKVVRVIVEIVNSADKTKEVNVCQVRSSEVKDEIKDVTLAQPNTVQYNTL